MATEVKLPRLGQGMESGTIVKWLKGEGEPVKKREPLYELDTDKVTQEVEAEATGVLLKILAGEGEEIEVGKTIAVIGEPGEEVPAGAPEPEAEEPAAAPEPEAEETAAAPEHEAEETAAPAEAPAAEAEAPAFFNTGFDLGSISMRGALFGATP